MSSEAPTSPSYPSGGAGGRVSGHGSFGPPTYPSSSSSASNGNLSPTHHVEGYDYEFVPPVETRYECPVCLLVLREPRQTKCGHRFCKDCILRWLRESGSRCPVDNEALTEADLFPDNFAKREILNFCVKCPNKDEGCDQIVALNKVQNHLLSCPLTPVPCPFQCTSIRPRKDMEEHVASQCMYRQVSCAACEVVMQAVDLQSHRELCSRVFVQCRHCGKQILRMQVNSHEMEDCENIVIHCPFYLFGCAHTMQRSAESEHLVAEVPSHMKQVCHAVADVIDQLKQSSGLTSNLLVPIRRISDVTDYRNQLPSPPSRDLNSSWSNFGALNSNFTAALERDHRGEEVSEGATNLFESPSPATPSHGRSPVTSILSQQGSLSGSCSRSPVPFSSTLSGTSHPTSSPSNAFLRHNTSDRVSASYPSQATSFPAHLQPASSSEGDSNSALQLEHSLGMNSSLLKLIQEMNSRFEESLSLHQKQVEDLNSKLEESKAFNCELLNRVKLLEGKMSDTEGKLQNGDYYWSINGYSEYQLKAYSGQTTVLHSPPFYTSASGYKLCLRANMNGIPSKQGGRHLSLFIHFMQGCNDHILMWPFTGQIVLSVLDQNPNTNGRKHMVETLEAKPDLAAFQKPTTDRNHKGFGYTEFISLAALANGTYIQDDTLVFRAQVFPRE